MVKKTPLIWFSDGNLCESPSNGRGQLKRLHMSVPLSRMFSDFLFVLFCYNVFPERIKEHKAAQPKNIHKRNSCALRGEEEAYNPE